MKSKKIYILIIVFMVGATLTYFSLYSNKSDCKIQRKPIEKEKIIEASDKDDVKNNQEKIEKNSVISSDDREKKTVEKNSVNTKPPAPHKGMVWVEPVYKTVYHPAEKVYEKVTRFRCTCKKTFDTLDAWQKHRPPQ